MDECFVIAWRVPLSGLVWVLAAAATLISCGGRIGEEGTWRSFPFLLSSSVFNRPPPLRPKMKKKKN
jgi:hypothetical protein